MYSFNFVLHAGCLFLPGARLFLPYAAKIRIQNSDVCLLRRPSKSKIQISIIYVLTVFLFYGENVNKINGIDIKHRLFVEVPLSNVQKTAYLPSDSLG